MTFAMFRKRGDLSALIITCIIAVLGADPRSAFSQAALPPEVQADILNRQIVSALKSRNMKAVLRAFDDYHRLESQGTVIPTPVLYDEVIAAREVGDSVREFDALSAYLRKAKKTERHYADALSLYPMLADAPAVRSVLASREAKSEDEKQVAAHDAECNQLLVEVRDLWAKLYPCHTQGCAEPLQKQREALIPKVKARGCTDAYNLDGKLEDRVFEDASK